MGPLVAFVLVELLCLAGGRLPVRPPPVDPPRPPLAMRLLGVEPHEYRPYPAAGNFVWSAAPPNAMEVERMVRARDLVADWLDRDPTAGAVVWVADGRDHYLELLNSQVAEGVTPYGRGGRRVPGAKHINSKSLIIVPALHGRELHGHMPPRFAESFVLRHLGHEVAHNQLRHAVGVRAMWAINSEHPHLFNEAFAEAVEVQTIADPPLRAAARRRVARATRKALDDHGCCRSELEAALHDQVDRGRYEAATGLFLAALDRRRGRLLDLVRRMPGRDPAEVAALSVEAMRAADLSDVRRWCDAVDPPQPPTTRPASRP